MRLWRRALHLVLTEWRWHTAVAVQLCVCGQTTADDEPAGSRVIGSLLSSINRGIGIFCRIALRNFFKGWVFDARRGFLTLPAIPLNLQPQGRKACLILKKTYAKT